jgi:hypothetical protein
LPETGCLDEQNRFVVTCVCVYKLLYKLYHGRNSVLIIPDNGLLDKREEGIGDETGKDL